jgi:plastocyanin
VKSFIKSQTLVFSAIAAFALMISISTALGKTVPLPLQEVVIIHMVESPDGTEVYFDPVGLHISPGQKVRWVQVRGYHSTTSYSPSNDNHELRIPEGAEPWDSGILQTHAPEKGSTFDHTFIQEGVYDYFCRPHEAAGMVGRIVVGRPLDGPGTRPFNYAPQKGWKPVPLQAQKAFPPISLILEKGVVHFKTGGGK